MAKIRRYYHGADDKGVTPTQFLDMPVTAKMPYIRHWLSTNFRVWTAGFNPPVGMSGGLAVGATEAPVSDKMLIDSPNTITVKRAMRLFPERLSPIEEDEVVRQLTLGESVDMYATADLPGGIAELHQAREQYRRSRLDAVVGKTQSPAPQTLRRWSEGRRINYAEQWLYENFTRTSPKDDRDPMRKSFGRALRSLNDPQWIRQRAMSTDEALFYFPYGITKTERQEIAEAIDRNPPQGLRGMQPLVEWYLKTGLSFNDLLEIKEANYAKGTAKRPKASRARAGKATPEGKREAIRIEVNVYINQALQHLPRAPRPGESGHNEYAAGQSEDPGLQARHAVEAIREEVNKPEPNTDALKERSGFLRRLIDGTKRRLGLMVDESAKELAKRGTTRVLEEVANGGAGSMASGAWTQALPYLEAIARTLRSFW